MHTHNYILSVYRSLDVYHTTVASELNHAREDNSSRLRESVGARAPPRQEVSFGSPAAVAVSRGLDSRDSASRETYFNGHSSTHDAGGHQPRHHSPYADSRHYPPQGDHYPPQTQYLREEEYAGAPSHGSGQGLDQSHYSFHKGHNSNRNYHSKDSHWDIDSQISTSSLPPPPYDHPRSEEEHYQQRRQLRAERETKKEKLLLQELNAGRPTSQSQAQYGQNYSRSYRQYGDHVALDSRSRGAYSPSVGASGGRVSDYRDLGSSHRHTSPAAGRPTSSMYASRPLPTAAGGRSSDSSELISRLRQSYLAKEQSSNEGTASKNEAMPAFNPSCFSSPSSSVGDATTTRGGGGHSSQLQSSRAKTAMVSKSEYEKAKQRLARR